MQVMPVRPGPTFFDSWAVCPDPQCGSNERDGTVWFVPHADEYRCSNEHRFTEETALWEVQAR